MDEAVTVTYSLIIHLLWVYVIQGTEPKKFPRKALRYWWGEADTKQLRICIHTLSHTCVHLHNELLNCSLRDVMKGGPGVPRVLVAEKAVNWRESVGDFEELLFELKAALGYVSVHLNIRCVGKLTHWQN